MKKFICIALALVLLIGCLTGCNLTQNLSGALEDSSEAAPKVEEMMLALAEAQTADAKSLMHPESTEISDDAFTQMSDYLAGRKVSSMEMLNININTSTDLSSTVRQEEVSYQLTLTDGSIIYLNAVYLSDEQGAGFTSFQLILGIV